MSALRLDRFDEEDASPYLIERRWSAAVGAAKTLQDECDVLHEVMALANQAWRDARLRLAMVEALRNELAECLCNCDASGIQSSVSQSGWAAI